MNIIYFVIEEEKILPGFHSRSWDSALFTKKENLKSFLGFLEVFYENCIFSNFKRKGTVFNKQMQFFRHIIGQIFEILLLNSTAGLSNKVWTIYDIKGQYFHTIVYVI